MEQIEKTLPDNLENAWYKRPGKRLSKAALNREEKAVWFRLPKKGESTAIHTHRNNSGIPSALDIVSFIRQGAFGVHTTVMACVKQGKVSGYVVIKPGKHIEIEKTYNYMIKLIAEGKPKTIEDKKRQGRRIKTALTRYGFNVRIISMPGFAPNTNWKKRRKKRVKKN